MIYAISKTCEFSAETLDKLEDEIVEHYSEYRDDNRDSFRTFVPIDYFIDENENEFECPAKFNDNLEDRIYEERNKMDRGEYDNDDLLKDYLRSVL